MWPSATLSVQLPPSTPYNFAVSNYGGSTNSTSTFSSFTLTWLGGDGATLYKFKLNDTAVTPSTPPTLVNGALTKTATFTGLSNTTAYVILVTAVLVNLNLSSGDGTTAVLPAPSGISVAASPAITENSFALAIGALVSGGTPTTTATSCNIYIGGSLSANTSAATITFTNQPAGARLKVSARSVYNGVEGWPFPYVDTVIAGTGAAADTGDGGLATNASINPANMYSIGTDSNGNIYLCCSSGIRKITTDGIINNIYPTRIYTATNLAIDSYGNLYFDARMLDLTGNVRDIANIGGQNNGYMFGGDGGPAIYSQFRDLNSVAVDNSGNVYLTDKSNAVVRMISISSRNSLGIPQFGNINTYTGIPAYYTTNPPLYGDLIFGNATPGFNGDGSPPTSVRLNNPTAVAVDSANNLYITDSGNNRIRKVTAGANSAVTTIVGGGSTAGTPSGIPGTSLLIGSTLWLLSADSTGNVYYSFSTTPKLIVKVTTDGIIHNIILPSSLSGMNVDNFGNVYYFKYNDYTIHRTTDFLPVQLIPRPVTMGRLTLSNISTTGFTISWSGGTAGDGVTSYSYYGAWPSTDNGLSGQNAIFTGLVSSNTYTISVTANKWGAPQTQQITIYAAASNLSVVSGSLAPTGFTLQIGTDAAGSPTGYNVYISTDASGTNFTLYTPTPVALGTNIPITSQTPASLIYIQVKAIIGGVEQWPSASFPVRLPPSAITNLLANAFTTSGFTLSWSGGVGATSYSFSNYTPSAPALIYTAPTIGAAQQSINFTGVDKTYAYAITVTASCGSASSPGGIASTVGYVFVPPVVNINGAVPSVNTSVITQTGFRVALNIFYGLSSYGLPLGWAGAALAQNFDPNGTVYSNVNIYISTDNVNFTLYPVPTTTLNNADYYVTGQIGGSLLYIYARPLMRGNIELWRTATAQVQLAAPTPIAFTNPIVQVASINARGFTITWTGGVGAASYSYNVLPAGSPQPSSQTTTSATFTNIPPGVSYSGSVTAVSQAGNTSTSPATPVSTVWVTPTYTTSNIATGSGSLYGLAFDGSGNLYYFYGTRLYVKQNTGTLAVPVYGTPSTIANTAGTTTAATSNYSANGDGGLATSATFNTPSQLIFDVQGNLYISDTTSHRIRMIKNTGTSAVSPSFTSANITTVAGDGTQPTLGNPRGMAFDQYNNLYICCNDSSSSPATSTVKLAPNFGTVTAPVINGFGPNLIIIAGGPEAVDCNTNGDTGLPTSAKFYRPYGVSFDATWNMYICEACHKIRKVLFTAATVATNGTVLCPVYGNISTVVGVTPGTNGTPTAGIANDVLGSVLRTPWATIFDAQGNMFIADFDTNVISMVPSGSSKLYVVAGLYTTGTFSGSALNATALNGPTALAFNSAGQLCYANSTASEINMLSGFTYVTPQKPVPNASLVAPTAVTSVAIVTGTLTSSGFKLSWQGGLGATSYAFTGAQPASYDMVARTATFTGLVSSTTYTISIAGMAGGASSVAGSFTIAAAPSGFASSGVTWNSFNITFTGVPNATSYNLYVGGVLYTDSPVSPSGTSFTNKPWSTTFIITVSALFGTVEMWPSQPFSVTTLAPPIPSTVVLGSTPTTINSSSFIASWTGGDPASSVTFLFSAGTPNSQPTTVDLVNKTATFTGMVGGQTYTAKMKATNVSGSSAWSGNFSFYLDYTINKVAAFVGGGGATSFTGYSMDLSGNIYYAYNNAVQLLKNVGTITSPSYNTTFTVIAGQVGLRELVLIAQLTQQQYC